MALKKTSLVALIVLAVIAGVWALWTHQSQRPLGIKIKSALMPASVDANKEADSAKTVLSSSPRGIAQKVESAAISLPGFKVQVQRFDAVSRSIAPAIETVLVSPRIQKATAVSSSKIVSVKPAAKIIR